MNSSSLLAAPLARQSWLKEVCVVLGASVLIALFAPVSIPLPFTPVPIATQPQVILILAALLGSRRGALAVACYLLQGAVGFPVFAGAKAGVAHLFGPTGGYLFGYVAAAYVTGFLVEKVFKRTSTQTLYALGIGNLVIYLVGLPWLSLFCGWKAACELGMLPFVLGDALKLLISVKVLKQLRFFSR